MNLKDLVDALRSIGVTNLTLTTLLIIALVYVMFWPDQARGFFGVLLSIVARVFHQVDKRAVAMRVEGDINAARSSLLKDAPEVIQGKLKIQWARGDEAAAIVRGGDVVVVMRRAAFHEENVAHAVMAYLPRSVVPLARHYLRTLTMQAIDFTLAKAILSQDRAQSGALSFLLEKHLEPARRANSALGDQLVAVDEIDLHGWLSRVLLSEFSRLGEVMYPGARDDRFEAEADELVKWLHTLAKRDPGESCALEYTGRFFKVAVVLVAKAARLYGEGLTPYQRRVVRLLYRDRMDLVYLMGRDDNIPVVRAIVNSLGAAGAIGSPRPYEYRLRADFAAKKLPRERAICVAVRKRGDEPPTDLASETYSGPELPEERFEPAIPANRGVAPAVFPFEVEEGVVAEIFRSKGYGFITDASSPPRNLLPLVGAC